METFDPATQTIIFTDSAKNHFKDVVSSAGAIGVRLGLTGGGCAGFSYNWELINDYSEVRLNEFTIKFDSWQFWLDGASKPYLVGSKIDKKVSIAGNQIEIDSPLAASSCGCGESVTFKL